MCSVPPVVSILALSATLLGCASTETANTNDQTRSGAHRAHADFVRAINANDADAVMAMLTHDAVFMAPNQPRLVGADDIRPWVEGYVDTYKTHWVKTTLELVELDGWAFEQYAYQSTDTPRAGGRAVRDTGKGIIVYRRDADGAWRVARDAWNSDLPPQN